MTTSPKESVSTRGVWPFPQDRFSWLMAGLLLALLLYVYYSQYYPRLDSAYNQTHTFTEQQPAVLRSNIKISLNVAVPRYISALSEQTLLLNLTNGSDSTVTVDIIPELTLENAETFRYYVFTASPDDVDGKLRSAGYLRFTDVPPGATVSRRLNFEVFALNQATQSDQTTTSTGNEDLPPAEVTPAQDAKGQAANSTGNEDPPLPTIRPSFMIRVGTGRFEPYPASTPLSMTVDPTRAVVLGVLSFVLLPPWANGFIPLVVIMAVYLFGLAEAKRGLAPTMPKGTRFAAVAFWVVLMTATAWCFIDVLTELAIAILNDTGQANGNSVVTSAAVFFLLVGVAVLVDWKLPEPPPTGGPGRPPPPAAQAFVMPSPQAGEEPAPVLQAVGGPVGEPGAPTAQPVSEKPAHQERKGDGSVATTPPPNREQQAPETASNRAARDDNEGIEAVTILDDHPVSDPSHESVSHTPSEPSDNVTPIGDGLLSDESDDRSGSSQSTAEASAADDSSRSALPLLLLPPPTDTAQGA